MMVQSSHINSDKEAISLPDSKRWACTICERNFSHPSDKSRHEKTHIGDRPYSCSQCHKTFTRNYHLLRHLKIHTGTQNGPKKEEIFACTICGKIFNTSFSCLRHEKTHGSREKMSMPLNTV